MNRRTRHVVVLVVAVVTASIASLGVYRAVERVPQSAEADQVPVVVAARGLPLGAKLTARDVKVVYWAARDKPDEAYRTVEEVVDRGLIAAVGEFDPITKAKLAPPDSGAGLPPAIPPGMRAISVRVNEVIGVAGFVLPNSRVDVVVTIRGEGGGGRSATVASNVQVLTEGTRQQQDRSSRRDDDESTVVTLLVTPDDALRVALAQTEGQIMLVLRNPQDDAPTMTKGVETRSLFGAPEQPAPVAKPAPRPRPAVVAAPVEPPPPPTLRVETVRAGKKSEEVIK